MPRNRSEKTVSGDAAVDRVLTMYWNYMSRSNSAMLIKWSHAYNALSVAQRNLHCDLQGNIPKALKKKL